MQTLWSPWRWIRLTASARDATVLLILHMESNALGRKQCIFSGWIYRHMHSKTVKKGIWAFQTSEDGKGSSIFILIAKSGQNLQIIQWLWIIINSSTVPAGCWVQHSCPPKLVAILFHDLKLYCSLTIRGRFIAWSGEPAFHAYMFLKRGNRSRHIQVASRNSLWNWPSHNYCSFPNCGVPTSRRIYTSLWLCQICHDFFVISIYGMSVKKILIVGEEASRKLRENLAIIAVSRTKTSGHKKRKKYEFPVDFDNDALRKICEMAIYQFSSCVIIFFWRDLSYTFSPYTGAPETSHRLCKKNGRQSRKQSAKKAAVELLRLIRQCEQMRVFKKNIFNGLNCNFNRLPWAIKHPCSPTANMVQNRKMSFCQRKTTSANNARQEVTQIIINRNKQ